MKTALLGLFGFGCIACFVGSFAALAETDTSSVPACVASEPQLSRQAAKPICEALLLLVAKDFDGASDKIREAQSVPKRNQWDNYSINQLIAPVASNRKDWAAALTATEALTRSPLLRAEDKLAVYHYGLSLNAVLNKPVRAIWFGEKLKQLGPLDAQYALILAQEYFANSEYAKAEATVQAALSSRDLQDDIRGRLRALLRNSQAKQGKQVAQSDDSGGKPFGGGLFGALGLKVEQPNDQPEQSGNTGTGKTSEPNMADEFFLNPTRAMTKYSSWQKTAYRFDSVELNQGWYETAFRELPNTVTERNQQQAQQGGWGNWMAMTQGPNRFNSIYILYCKFPPGDAGKIANIRLGDTREISLKLKQTQGQALIFDCRL